MGRRKDKAFDEYLKKLSTRLVAQGILQTDGGQSLNAEAVRRIEEVERELFLEEHPEYAEEYPEVDSFALYLFLTDQEDPLPEDPETFLRAYHDLRETFNLNEFIREDADSDATEAHEFSNRGNSRLHMGRIPEALEDFDRACDLAPDDAFVHSTRSNALYRTGNLEKSLEDIERAISLSEGEGPWPRTDYLLFKGEILSRLKDYKGAKALLESALTGLWTMARSPQTDDGDFRLSSNIILSDGLLVKIYYSISDFEIQLRAEEVDTGKVQTSLERLEGMLEEKEVL